MGYSITTLGELLHSLTKASIIDLGLEASTIVLIGYLVRLQTSCVNGTIKEMKLQNVAIIQYYFSSIVLRIVPYINGRKCNVLPTSYTEQCE